VTGRARSTNPSGRTHHLTDPPNLSHRSTRHTTGQGQTTAIRSTRSAQDAAPETTHPNRPTTERTSSSHNTTDAAATEPTRTARMESAETPESNQILRPRSSAPRLTADPQAKAGPVAPSGVDPDALYAYHLERVTRKFTTVISADNAELLGRLLGSGNGG
jgi:hypothetical protein